MTVRTQPDPLVKKITINGGGNEEANDNEEQPITLDGILAKKERVAAKRYNAASMEQMALEAENEAARLRGEPPRYGGGKMVTETADEERKLKQEQEKQAQADRLVAQAKVLLDSGMPPQQVGLILQGLSPANSGMQYIPQAPGKQGVDFDDFLKMYKLMNENRETGELKDMVKSLQKTIDEMKKDKEDKRDGRGERDGRQSAPPDPLATFRAMKETATVWRETLLDLGMVSEPGANNKQSLDELKEKHRHEEKLKELESEDRYKQSNSDTLASIPELLGKGIGGMIRGGATEQDGNTQPPVTDTSNRTESHKCVKCGNMIFAPPDATHVTCPKCGKEYDLEYVDKPSKQESQETQVTPEPANAEV